MICLSNCLHLLYIVLCVIHFPYDVFQMMQLSIKRDRREGITVTGGHPLLLTMGCGTSQPESLWIKLKKKNLTITLRICCYSNHNFL